MYLISTAPQTYALQWRSVVMVCVLVLVLVVSSHQAPQAIVKPDMFSAASTPLVFVPTTDPHNQNLIEASTIGGVWNFSRNRLELATPTGRTLQVAFPYANQHVQLRGADMHAEAVRLYQGADVANWNETGVQYGAVVYDELFEGVSLHYNGDTRQIKGTYTVAPNADPAQIRWNYPGSSQVSIDQTSGDLQIVLHGETIIERAPVAWQDTAARRAMVDVRFAQQGETVGFALGSYDAALPLVIDPELVYSSYLGGNSDEEGRGIARDAAGNLYVTGKTYSTDFAGSANKIAGSDDLFVAKFTSSGKLVYRTLVGGKSSDTGIGIAVNGAGEVAVTAYTASLDFPLVNSLVSTKPDYNGAILKLDASGKLIFSSYLEIDYYTTSQNVAFDRTGQIVLAGTDWAGATEGRENAGIRIIRADSTKAEMVRAFNFGGDWVDEGHSLAIGPNGKIYIGGMTYFRDGGFPLSNNAFQQECGTKSYGASEPFCDEDAFVAILDPEATNVLFATYLGGNGHETVYGIGVDNAGNTYVVGTTASQNFPTKNAFQGQWLGADNFSNGFITKFNPDLSNTLYSSYFSSLDEFGSEYLYGMAVDGAGNLAITGSTGGQYLPVKDPIQAELDGRVCIGSTERYCSDAFVSTFDANGGLTFSTYLGGDDDDIGYGIVGDGAGGFWLAGRTEASDFPVTADATQPRAMMQSDAFVTHIDTKPTSVGQPKTYLPLLRR